MTWRRSVVGYTCQLTKILSVCLIVCLSVCLSDNTNLLLSLSPNTQTKPLQSRARLFLQKVGGGAAGVELATSCWPKTSWKGCHLSGHLAISTSPPVQCTQCHIVQSFFAETCSRKPKSIVLWISMFHYRHSSKNQCWILIWVDSLVARHNPILLLPIGNAGKLWVVALAAVDMERE